MNNNRKTFMLIVDGSSLLATSYYASLPRAIRKEKDDEKKEELYPQLLKNDGNGHYCNALELFFHTLFTIMTFQRPSHLVVCWDAGRNTFRRELWELYKSNRQSTPTPLRQQFELAYDICQQLGIAQVRDSRYEADDFAGTIASKMSSQIPVRIYTRDKDYFQLIDDRVKIWYGMADLKKVKEWRKVHHMPPCLPSRVVLIDRQVLKKEFGYFPESVPMIKCLFGDASDNIPGVSGMGESRSIKLAAHYTSLDELYADVEKANSKNERRNLNRLWRSWGIYVSPYTALTKKATADRKSAKEMAEICYTLGKIRTDLDLEDCFEQGMSLEQFACHFDADQIVSILKNYAIDLKIARNKFKSTDQPQRVRVYDEYKDNKQSPKKKTTQSNRNKNKTASTKPALQSSPSKPTRTEKKNDRKDLKPTKSKRMIQQKVEQPISQELKIKNEYSNVKPLKSKQQESLTIDFDKELEKMFSMTIANRNQIMEDYWPDQEENIDQVSSYRPKTFNKQKQNNRSNRNRKKNPNANSYVKEKENLAKPSYHAKNQRSTKENKRNDLNRQDKKMNVAQNTVRKGQENTDFMQKNSENRPRRKRNVHQNRYSHQAQTSNRNANSAKSNAYDRNAKRAQANRGYANRSKTNTNPSNMA